MKLEKVFSEIEAEAEKFAPAMRIAAVVRNAVLSIAVLIVMGYLQNRFHIVQMLLEAGKEEPYAMVGFFVIITAMILALLSMIIAAIADLIALKDPYGPAALTSALIKYISEALFPIVGGLFFIGAGIFCIVNYIMSFNFGGLVGGAITTLMGMVPFIYGVVSVINAVRYYKAYMTGDAESVEERVNYFGAFVELAMANLPQILVGAVFALVPFLMLGLILSTPDMEPLASLFLVMMGLIFGAIGIGVLVWVLKPIIEQLKNGESRLTKEEEEEYKDISIK